MLSRHQPVADVGDRPDALLIDAVTGGDRDALGEIYRRYGAACYGLARRIVGDEGLAEDVVQEVFVALWRRSSGYDQAKASVKTWLLSITHHKSVDAVRREDVHRRRRDNFDLLYEEPAGGSDVAELADDSLRANRIRAALQTLPEAQRTPLLLAYFGGYTQQEIAQLIDVPLGTVKTRTFAGLRRLRDALAGDAPDSFDFLRGELR
ncbi:MAG TPA: sigma-70 family RNA polymerase sigma factor [Mycobacteriales bacterium]|nr:sigma-70 family RNA polymerase sigma factor [Mycobacteriales bacterium]